MTDVRPVWKGQGGWLFERPDLIQDFQLEEPVRPYLDRLASALRARGVLPVALVLPTRGALHSAQMGDNPAFRGYDPEAARREYRDFLAMLREAGFIAPDLAARGQGAPFFFARDHHWSPSGARRSARQVAAALESPLAELPKRRFVTRRLAPKMQRGSLQRRAERRCGVRLPNERVAQFETVLETEGDSLGEALFADPVPPVVLAGSSNSNRGEGKPELNFSGFLREELGLEVLNASFVGPGATGALQAYLLSEEYRAAPPEALVWETRFASWHHHPSLGAELRQVVPSVYGACSLPESLAHQRVKVLREGATPLLNGLGELGLQGSDVYLHLKFDDVTLVDFGLGLEHWRQREQVDISRLTRVPNTGEFFLELSDAIPSRLHSVTLHAPQEVEGGVQVRVCRVPPSAR